MQPFCLNANSKAYKKTVQDKYLTFIYKTIAIALGSSLAIMFFAGKMIKRTGDIPNFIIYLFENKGISFIGILIISLALGFKFLFSKENQNVLKTIEFDPGEDVFKLSYFGKEEKITVSINNLIVKYTKEKFEKFTILHLEFIQADNFQTLASINTDQPHWHSKSKTIISMVKLLESAGIVNREEDIIHVSQNF